jgi:hypothetical protein
LPFYGRDPVPPEIPPLFPLGEVFGVQPGLLMLPIEDGVIWVYGVGEDGVLAFTDFGIESLIELINMYEDDPTPLKRYDPQ